MGARSRSSKKYGSRNVKVRDALKTQEDSGSAQRTASGRYAGGIHDRVRKLLSAQIIFPPFC
jgi:hypothetical protein